MSAAPLLSVQGLTRDYATGLFGTGRRRRAVDDVSFDMAAGEILGIVGESGCGKSTLARLVMALDRPTAGRVVLAGDPLFALSGRALARRRRDLQMIFQDPLGSLDPRQRVGPIVAEPLHGLGLGRGERMAWVDAMLQIVGLAPEQAGLYPHQVSGGQRQRIAIARALITGPKLVVADEPTSALDVSVQAQVLNLLLDMRDRLGTAVLLISHNLAAVQAVADRVGVMLAGRIVEMGPALAVFDAPLHPYARQLAEAEPRLGGAAPISRPQAAEALADWSGCAFRSRCGRATERCSRETPLLGAMATARAVACHHPETG